MYRDMHDVMPTSIYVHQYILAGGCQKKYGNRSAKACVQTLLPPPHPPAVRDLTASCYDGTITVHSPGPHLSSIRAHEWKLMACLVSSDPDVRLQII